MEQNFKWNKLTVGTCYYPEHWEEQLWEQDLIRMKEAGISVIRIAEFAWSKVELKEGEFDFSFFDRFLDLCAKAEMKVIFGTPTATPPAWLTEKYPEVLNGRKDGALYRHGSRRHYNYNSAVYQELSKRIVTKIAEHYGQHSAIVGWQIDNELNCEVCEFYSEADTKAFRTFLKEKYQSLEELNQAWGAVFWNQTYTDWEQVYLPRVIPGSGINPHMQLDYFRFISDSTIRFCKMQAEIIRRYRKPEDFITTNGKFWNIDNHRMEKECLDVYTYDSYPDFAFELGNKSKEAKNLNDRHWSMNLTEVRSICPHFGIMEQQSGANGWTTCMEAPAPRPGQLTLWAMQSVAHGADYISFFRWRTCTMGTEIYWHGILDYDNRDNRKIREVKDFHHKLEAIQPICGADFAASFAILKDYDNEWDTSVDRWHSRVASFSENEIFAAAQLSYLPYDVVYLQGDSRQEDLAKYPVLIYPHPVIAKKEYVELLEHYVEQGGTLIIGCRSGYKDETGKCVMTPQPGLFMSLTGTDIHDFTFTSPAEEEISVKWGEKSMDAPVFNDILTPLEGTKVLAVYADSYYAGEAALTERKRGKGRVLHFGSAFSRENAKAILEYAGAVSPFEDLITAADEVELVMRKKDGKEYLFVLNYADKEVEIELKKELHSLYDNAEEQGTVTLPAFATRVYSI